MTKKIFRSMVITAGAVLLASLIIIMGCLYDYFCGVQEQQLKDELSLAAAAVEQGGADYLASLQSDRYRLTWVSADGTVLYDTQADAAAMENHAQRQEIRQALLAGQGESSRYSATLLEKTLYCARRLDDGTVLRISISRATAGVLVLGMLQPFFIVLVVALVLSALWSRSISWIWSIRWTMIPMRSCRRCWGASTSSAVKSMRRCRNCSASGMNLTRSPAT